MGEKDVTEKILVNYNDVFSDILNVCIFDGKTVVQEDELKDIQPISGYKAEDGIHEEERDTLKHWGKNGVTFSIFGLENESVEEGMMPVRIIGYDGAAYRTQMLDGQTDIHPVLTLVLYFGLDHEWKKPLHLKDVLVNDGVPDEIMNLVNNYEIHVINVAWLSDETIRKFKSDFSEVALFFRNKRLDANYIPSNDKEIIHVDSFLKLLGVMTRDDHYNQIISKLNENKKNNENKSTDEKRRFSMDTVAQNLITIGRNEVMNESIDLMKGLNLSESDIEEKLISTYHIDKQEAERLINENNKVTV